MASTQSKHSGEVTIQHISNSLAQIGAWTEAVRAALSGLPPQTPLPMSNAEALSWSASPTAPLRVAKNCPPPKTRRPRHKKGKKK